MTLGCVVAPFGYQPTRAGLGRLGVTGPGLIPVGAGAGVGASVGASQGASIGSAIVPGIGTAIGAVVGAIGGAIAGSINKKDPEQYNFDAAVALWQQNPDAIYSIGNKYLVLAGLFDLNLDHSCSSRWCIPMYVKYGRMGEQRFTNDLVMLVSNAAQSGQITAADTPLSIYNRIVQPWINSWGLGALNDPHADLITRLLIGMVWDYTDGSWKQNWHAVGGQFPFGNLPMFTLPAAQVAATPAVAAASPPPVAAVTPVTTSPQAPVAWPSTLIQPVGSNWQNTSQPSTAPAPTPPPPTPPPTSTIQPTGSGAVTAASVPPSGPQQLVATPPAAGTVVMYAPDLSQGSIPIQLPSGLVFVGIDPASKSWILQYPATGAQYILWQGNLQNYGASAAIPQVTTPSPTVATTSSGASVTQADLQALVSQLAAQGQTASQAYTTALQTLQSSGVAATPAVQSAVQSAVTSTPAPEPASIGGFLSTLSPTAWLLIGGAAFLMFKRSSHTGHRA